MPPTDQLGAEAPGELNGVAAGSAGRRWSRVVVLALLGLLGAGVLVLLLAQLFLPGIAAQRVREEVGRYGSVDSVKVSAAPAIELLWHAAEQIDVAAGTLRASPGDLAGLEDKLGDVEKATLTTPALELSFSSLVSGQVTLRDVTLTKKGTALSARGSVSEADVHLALPAGLQVESLESVEGQPQVAVGGELLGARIAGHAVMAAREGKLVVEPVGIPFAGLAQVTVFSSPDIYVESVTATPREQGFTVSLQARTQS